MHAHKFNLEQNVYNKYCICLMLRGSLLQPRGQWFNASYFFFI